MTGVERTVHGWDPALPEIEDSSPAAHRRGRLDAALSALGETDEMVPSGGRDNVGHGLFSWRQHLRDRVWQATGSDVEERLAPITTSDRMIEPISTAVPPDLLSFGLDAMCDIFRLTPNAQWKTALNTTLGTSRYSRLWILEADTVNAAHSAILSGAATDADYHVAAWHVILEGWAEAHSDLVDDVAKAVHRLPDSAAGSAHPALRIALAIRRLLTTDDAPTDSLAQLAAAPDCAALMAKAGWMAHRGAQPLTQRRPRKSAGAKGTKKR
jgi:hypothetical protein